MNWPVFGKAFLCETLYSIPFFILALFPFRKTHPDDRSPLCHSMPKSLLSMRKGQSVETAFPVFFHFQLYSYTARNLFFPGKLFFFRLRSHVLFASQ